MNVNISLKELLSLEGLVTESPHVETIIQRTNETQPQNIKIFYGETYDEAGNTIDSMKYYLFAANLSDVLKTMGYDTDPVILVADTAACRNVSQNLQSRYMQLGAERTEFVEKVNRIYNCGLHIVKMSEYIDEPDFQSDVKKIIDLCESDPELMKMIEESIPPSKVDIEREKGFMYSFDEIATILGYDIKIGPPREDLYDKTAREIAKRLDRKQIMSIFLMPTFPVGLGWDYFFAHEDLEKYGITAYKGMSKRLQKYRILIGKTSPEYVDELIHNSFISTRLDIPNPILDIGIIVEMAKQRLKSKTDQIHLHKDFYNGKISPNDLKDYVSQGLREYVLNKLV